MLKRVSGMLYEARPVMVMVIVMIAFAGINIFYKLAAVDGMNLRILVAYRFLFADAFIVPFAFIVERVMINMVFACTSTLHIYHMGSLGILFAGRFVTEFITVDQIIYNSSILLVFITVVWDEMKEKRRPRLTWIVVGQSFLCGLFGGSLLQNLYLSSLALTSATFASAMANLVPAVTFILAVSFRFESLLLRSVTGKAKLAGTLIGVGGAMVLTFYKGIEIKLWTTNINLISSSHHNNTTSSSSHSGSDRAIGALLSLAAACSYSTWLIVQTKMSKRYPSHYSSTALMCLMASIQATVVALIFDHNWDHWKLGWNIRLYTVAYTGIIGSGLMISMAAWCVRMRGPLFVSVFNPLMLVIVAIAGSLLLDEKLYLGTVVGSVLIIAGLYAVLWGKTKEYSKSKQCCVQPIISPTNNLNSDNDPISEVHDSVDNGEDNTGSLDVELGNGNVVAMPEDSSKGQVSTPDHHIESRELAAGR